MSRFLFWAATQEVTEAEPNEIQQLSHDKKVVKR